MTVTFFIGCVLLAGAALAMLRLWWIDLTMQRHRVPGAPRAAFWFLPFRWQRSLYVGEGPALVDRAWRSWRFALGLAILGLIFVALGHA